MKKYKIAAWLMIIHGGIMELGGALCMIPAVIWETSHFDIGKDFPENSGDRLASCPARFSHNIWFEIGIANHYWGSDYFQDNLYMMIVMGAIYGVLRLSGAIGLLQNRMWGLVLSTIHCVSRAFCSSGVICVPPFLWEIALPISV